MAFRLRVERIVDPGGRRILDWRVTEERLRRSLFRILQETALCSMATVNRLNRAHINTAYFAFSEDLELYFLSDPGAVHCRNLSGNPSMAITIFNSSQRWGKPDKGLQLFGACQEAKGRQVAKAERVYGKRFPEYAERTTGAHRSKREAPRLRSYRFYRFLPGMVKVFDEREFGSGIFVGAAILRRRAE